MRKMDDDEKIKQIHAESLKLMKLIENLCKNNIERTFAIQKVIELSMWARNSILAKGDEKNGA